MKEFYMVWMFVIVLVLGCAQQPGYLKYSVEDGKEAEKINEQMQIVKAHLAEVEAVNSANPNDSLIQVMDMLNQRLIQLENLHRIYKQSADDYYKKYKEAGGGLKNMHPDRQYLDKNP